MKKIKSLLLYAGLDKETNLKYKDHLLTNDVKNLSYYLIVAGVLYLVLGIVSALSSGFAQINTRLYLITALAFGVIFLLRKLTVHFWGSAAKINRLYIYLFMAVLYLEAITLTTMHKDMPAVTYIGILLVLPLLFAQYPIPMILFQTCFVVVFCVMVSYFKYPEVAAVDIWNGISFLFVSVMAIMLVIPMRFNQIIQPEIIRELSEKDALTGVKNRNSFETFCSELRNKNSKITCIYSDVNGLHELNNEYGHEAGDNMLKAVAETMKKHYGSDNVYRIGGDEFFAFSSEFDTNLIENSMLDTKKELNDMGYHLSMGYASTEKSKEELDDIIKQAESSMFSDKNTYYRETGIDRRRS